MADTEADAIINWLSTLNATEQGKIARIENLAKDIYVEEAVNVLEDLKLNNINTNKMAPSASSM